MLSVTFFLSFVTEGIKNMKIESLALWNEKYLFSEQGNESRGFFGYIRGCIQSDGSTSFDGSDIEPPNPEDNEELSVLIRFLQNEGGHFIARSVSDMTAYCCNRMSDHIPYSFCRECWGFRVLTEKNAWYIALTPWNEHRQYEIYGYDRDKLMSSLAAERGLPERCYGVLKFTGERVLIRFGGEMERFPQYGSNATDNMVFAAEQNERYSEIPCQLSAMQEGAINGWDTPAADPTNYDAEGHFSMSLSDTVKGVKRK